MQFLFNNQLFPELLPVLETKPICLNCNQTHDGSDICPNNNDTCHNPFCLQKQKEHPRVYPHHYIDRCPVDICFLCHGYGHRTAYCLTLAEPFEHAPSGADLPELVEQPMDVDVATNLTGVFEEMLVEPVEAIEGVTWDD